MAPFSSAGLPASVALLGTGPMEAPIARNIIAEGVPL
jgi:2-hydroxy-3-oxopropionate reductase